MGHQFDRRNQPTESMETVFEALTNNRRRAVLEYLLTEEPIAELPTVVEYVAAKENGTDPTEVTVDQRNRVRTALYQHHLEKLDDYGFVDYDKRAGLVERNGRTERIEPYLTDPPSGGSGPNGYASGLFMAAIGFVLAWVPELATVMALVLGGVGSALVLIAHRTDTPGAPSGG